MLAAEAQVKTDDPGRYLTQLCRHAQQVHRLRHRPQPKLIIPLVSEHSTCWTLGGGCPSPP